MWLVNHLCLHVAVYPWGKEEVTVAVTAMEAVKGETFYDWEEKRGSKCKQRLSRALRSHDDNDPSMAWIFGSGFGTTIYK